MVASSTKTGNWNIQHTDALCQTTCSQSTTAYKLSTKEFLLQVDMLCINNSNLDNSVLVAWEKQCGSK